jgi:carboxymethylenebutenolidase
MSEHITIPRRDADIPGVLAVPASGSGIGVLVIQEWWGLVPHIASVVDRLAAAGFVALAPDLYRGVNTTEPDEAGKLMMGLQVAEAGGDIAAAADYLVRRPELTSAQLGIVGFCMGGGLALLGPTVTPHIFAASAFYPAMPWPEYSPAWANYADRTALVHQAESDLPSTGDSIASYAKDIRAHGGDAIVETYLGTQHAFFNDDRPEVYNADAAALAWDRTLELFRTLG